MALTKVQGISNRKYCSFFRRYIFSSSFPTNVSTSDAGAINLIKLREVSETVWISFEALIIEKTIKEEWMNRNNFDDNYNLV